MTDLASADTDPTVVWSWRALSGATGTRASAAKENVMIIKYGDHSPDIDRDARPEDFARFQKKAAYFGALSSLSKPVLRSRRLVL